MNIENKRPTYLLYFHYSLDFFRNSIWSKNLTIKMPKRAILSTQWSFERSLLISKKLKLLFLCLFIFHTQLISSEISSHQSIVIGQAYKKVDQLLFAMQQRLLMMHEVARTKWNFHLPIEDLPREQDLLNALVKQAQEFGLEEKWVTRFFQAQFDAAKMIQKHDFVMWENQKQGQFKHVLDLKQEIRPHLNQLSVELLQGLANIRAENHENDIIAYCLSPPFSSSPSEAIDPLIWQIALSPFSGTNPY